jgi:hypothetical protein
MFFFVVFIAVMLVGSTAHCFFFFYFLVLSNLETRPTKTKVEQQAESKQAEGMLLA